MGPGPERPARPAPPAAEVEPGKIIGIVVGVLVLVGAGLGAAVYWQVGQSDRARTHLVAPDKLGGRPRITGPDMTGALSSVGDDLKRVVTQPGTTIVQTYGDVSTLDFFFVFAVQGTVSDPATVIDGEFDGVTQGDGVTTANERSIDPGPLGGSAKCADATLGGAESMGICGWADHGSVGLFMVLGERADELAANFADLRGQIESRG